MVDGLTTRIITDGNELPPIDDRNFFHSRGLFELCRQTPRHKPYMVVVESPDGQLLSHLLAIVRRRSSFFPPYLYKHCVVMGEGVYDGLDDEAAAPEGGATTLSLYTREELFGMMLSALQRKMQNRVLYMEVSHLSSKMFGYREFRRNKFFPVHWMSIHNSLHSRAPEERISERMTTRIEAAYARGVTTDEVTTETDFAACMKLLRRHNMLKPKRFVPADEFFRGLRQQGCGRLFVTKYKEHVVGCSACVYSQNNAYLWYAAFRRKSFLLVHPDVLTVWHVLKDSHQRGFDHVFFMDVGLPFSKNPFREFILRFGGKPASTNRWFHCPVRWVNSLLSWVYRE